MAKTNTISTINRAVPGNEYLSMSPVDCLASAKAMHDEIVKQDSRLWVLADKARSELVSLQEKEDNGAPAEALSPVLALSLVELLCDLMNDFAEKYRLQHCLDALQIHYGNETSKIAA